MKGEGRTISFFLFFCASLTRQILHLSLLQRNKIADSPSLRQMFGDLPPRGEVRASQAPVSRRQKRCPGSTWTQCLGLGWRTRDGELWTSSQCIILVPYQDHCTHGYSISQYPVTKDAQCIALHYCQLSVQY